MSIRSWLRGGDAREDRTRAKETKADRGTASAPAPNGKETAPAGEAPRKQMSEDAARALAKALSQYMKED